MYLSPLQMKGIKSTASFHLHVTECVAMDLKKRDILLASAKKRRAQLLEIARMKVGLPQPDSTRGIQNKATTPESTKPEENREAER